MRRTYPFLIGMANLLAGAFMVIATFAWTAGTAVDLGFAISIALVVFGLTMTLLGARGYASAERIAVTVLGGLTTLVAAWTIVATQVFATGPARWLVFASGLAHVAISAASLVVHEVSTERVVHHLEVSREREPIATG